MTITCPFRVDNAMRERAINPLAKLSEPEPKAESIRVHSLPVAPEDFAKADPFAVVNFLWPYLR
jgi:hypothetical protein